MSGISPKLIGVTEACSDGARPHSESEKSHSTQLHSTECFCLPAVSLSADIKDIRAGRMRCNLAHLCELCLNAFADVEIWFRKMNKQTGSTDINEKLKTAGGYNCEKEKSLLFNKLYLRKKNKLYLRKKRNMRARTVTLYFNDQF